MSFSFLQFPLPFLILLNADLPAVASGIICGDMCPSTICNTGLAMLESSSESKNKNLYTLLIKLNNRCNVFFISE